MQTRSIVALSWFNFVRDDIEKWDFLCCIGWKAFIGYLCPKYYFSRLCICRPTGFDIVNLDYYGIFSFCNKTRRATSNNMHICSLFGMGQLKTQSGWSNVYFIFISIVPFFLYYAISYCVTFILRNIADSAQTEYCTTFHCSSVCPSVRSPQAWHLTFLTYIKA